MLADSTAAPIYFDVLPYLLPYTKTIQERRLAMIDFTDLLGQVMQSGMSSTGQDRMKHAMGDRGLRGAGGILSDIMGGLQSGASGGGISDMGRIAERC